MKKIITALTISVIVFYSSSVYAQAWQKDSKVLSLSFGASQYFNLVHESGGGIEPSFNHSIPSFNAQLSIQGEFGIHPYLGVGFITGLGMGGVDIPPWSAVEMYIPLGFITNFHFYQFMADKSDKKMRSDKLDMYLGGNIGSGVAIGLSRSAYAGPILFGGGQFGVRYYIIPTVGITGELGYGKSVISCGVVFKPK